MSITTTLPATDRREIRVFISSTFRDMMRERDLLVKRVFPALRRVCARRFVTFTEVDLRWGITEEQAAEGQVLPLCLAEIERSRPNFIGLLGERYGWIPEEIPAAVLAAEPWLEAHLHGRKSVTELEILHGVLNDPEMHGHAYFYFRDPAYGLDPEKFPDLTDAERRELAERDIPAEIEKFGPAEAARRTQERKEKLAALKQRIRDSGLPLVDPYADPKALAAIIEKQVGDLIDKLYPEGETPDPLTQERLMHEAHAKNKLFACIERPAHLAALTAFSDMADHGGKGVVVTGESGGGKTALLADWAGKWGRENPDDFLFQHYFGATPNSSSPDGFLRRLLGELKARFGLTDEIPTDPERLREVLPIWLASVPRDVRVVLVLDGLNQLRGSEADRHLVFLPRHFPPHVTVIASALPGLALDALRERGWTAHDLPPASEAEVDAMVGEYFRLLGRHVDTEGRPLQTPLRRQLVAAPGCRNPLFLRTVLEELRQFGSFEHLPARVAGYLEATTPQELFGKVLRRWEEDFDGKDPQALDFALTRRALTHLWAAREGLSESEWLDLLGMDGSIAPDSTPFHHSSFIIQNSPLPRAYWTPLFLALEPHLSQRAGLFAFGHDFLRQAVEALFIPETEAQKGAHLAVADYFERHEGQREMTPRKAAEWPFQLHAAQAWDRLEACLADIPLFLALYNDRTKWELTGYWHPLRKLGRDMGLCYTSAYGRWIEALANVGHAVPAQLGAFLHDNGLYVAADPFLQLGLGISNMALGPEHPDTLISQVNAAALQNSKGDYAGSEPLYRRALEASERSLGPDHPITLASVSGLAVVLYRKGANADAEPLCRRALESIQRGIGAEHPTTLICLNNLAELLANRGEFADAEQMFRRAVDASEQNLGPENPQTLTCLEGLAGLLVSKGDYAGAEPLHRRALEACERVLGPEHPDTLSSRSNLAGLLFSKGDYRSAEPLFRSALKSREIVLGTEHPDTLVTRNNLAELLCRTGDYQAAEPLHRQTVEVSERVLGLEHPSTLSFLNNLAESLRRKGDLVGAEPIYRRAIECSERVLGVDHPNTLVSANNLAFLFETKGDDASAEPLYRRTLEARERVLGSNHPNTLNSLNNLAELLARRGNFEEAEILHRRGLKSRELVLGADHADTQQSLNNLAALLFRKGNYSAAEPLFRRAIEGLAKISLATQRRHPNLESYLGNYVACLEKLGHSRHASLIKVAIVMHPFGMGLPGVFSLENEKNGVGRKARIGCRCFLYGFIAILLWLVWRWFQ